MTAEIFKFESTDKTWRCFQIKDVECDFFDDARFTIAVEDGRDKITESFTKEEFEAFIEHLIWLKNGGD